MSLLGWIIVQQQLDDDADAAPDESELDEALQHFEAVLDQQSGHLEALMGKAKVWTGNVGRCGGQGSVWGGAAAL